MFVACINIGSEGDTAIYKRYVGRFAVFLPTALLFD